MNAVKKSQYKDANTLRILYQTFGVYRWQTFLLVFLGLLGGALEGFGIGAIVPLLSFLMNGGQQMGGAISTIIASGFDTLSIRFAFRNVIGLILALFTFRAVVLSVSAYIRAHISADFMNREMGDLFQRTLSAEWGFLLQQRAGYLQNTIVRDVQKTSILFEVFAQAIQSFTGFCMYLIIALSMSPGVTVLTLMLGAGLLLFLRPLVKKTREIGEETVGLEKLVAHHITEHISGLKTVKASGEEAVVLTTVQQYLESLRRLFIRNAFIHSLGRALFQPVGLFFILAIFYFAYKAPGFNLALFAATIYLIQKIFVYLESGQNALHSISELVPFAGNIQRYKFSSKQKRESFTGTDGLFHLEKEIVLKDVSLSYEGRGEVLSHISTTFKKGSVTGIVGPSGAGKTSLVDLLLRLFRPSGGGIFLDNQNLEEVDLNEWRKHVGYVSQDLFLLNDSIENNIRFYDESLTQDQIEDAAKRAYVYDVIQALPEGFKTNIGDKGVMLSGGQRQRIVLARVLARKPDILILDEATSALDSESEKYIKQAVKKLHGKATVLIIAHRLTTVMDADRLLVIDGGKIVEEGNPQELLKDQKSRFHKLANLAA